MKLPLKDRSQLLPAALAVIAFAIFVWYFIFLFQMAGATRFIADDYCSYGSADRLGWARFAWYWFITWGGRLSAISADMLLVVLGQRGIGYAAFISLLGWVAGIIAIVYPFTDPKVGRVERLMISALAALSFVYMVTRALPNFIQTLFWFSAFRTHTLPVILFTGWVLIAFTARGGGKYFPLLSAVLFAYAFANGLFSEVFTTLFISTLGLLFLARAAFRPSEWLCRSNQILLTGLAGGLAALALLLFAPGTLNREASFAFDRSIGGVLSIAFDGTYTLYRVVFKELSRGLGIAALLLAAFWSAPIFKRIEIAPRVRFWVVLGLAILGPLFVFTSFLPGAYGMGEFIPRRAFSVPIFFGFTAWVAAAIIAGQAATARRAGLGRSLVLGLAIAALVGSWVGNYGALSTDLNRMRQYAARVDQLETSAREALNLGETSLTIGKLGNWAGVYDPSDNPKFWVTKCFSEYYGIEIVGPPIK